MISDAESIQDKAPELVPKVMSGELPIDKAAKTRQEKRQPNGSAKRKPPAGSGYNHWEESRQQKESRILRQSGREKTRRDFKRSSERRIFQSRQTNRFKKTNRCATFKHPISEYTLDTLF